jgi:hypothetical protein
MGSCLGVTRESSIIEPIKLSSISKQQKIWNYQVKPHTCTNQTILDFMQELNKCNLH